MTGRAVAVAVALLLATASDASQGFAARSAPPLDHPVSLRRALAPHVSDQEPVAPQDLARAIASGRATLQEVIAMRRAVLSAPRDLGGLGGIDPRALVGGQAGAGGDAPTQPTLIPMPAGGDATGDGLDDLYTLESGDSWDEFRLRARDGRDGSVFWSRTFTHPDPGNMDDISLFVVFLYDFSGDGVDEPLVLHERYQTDVAETPVASVAEITVTDSLASIDVRDGSDAWTWTIDGSYQALVASMPGVEAYVIGATNILYTIDVMPDVQRARGAELFITSLGYEAAGTGLDPDVRYLRAHVTSDVRDGATGAPLGLNRADGGGVLPWLAPSADVSGDGLPDVLVAESGVTSSSGGTIGVHPLGGEIPYWTKPTQRRHPVLRAAELDGAGSPDILVLDDSPLARPSEALRGEDGSTLWAREAGGVRGLEVPDLDGDGGADLVEFRVEPLEGNGHAILVEARRGADASALWGPSALEVAAGAAELVSLRVCCVEDLTGDGVVDPMLTAAVSEQQCHEDFCDEVEARAEQALLDGVDGTRVWTARASSSDGLALPIGGDVNGDGTSDVEWSTTRPSADDPARFDLTVVLGDGGSLAPLWTAARANVEPNASALVFAANLSGDAADEIVAAFHRTRAGQVSLQSAAAYGPAGLLWETSAAS